MGGPGWRLEGLDLAWTIPAGAGLPIEHDDTGVDWLVVSAQAAPAVVEISLLATTSAGVELRAVKAVEVGAPRRENPRLVRFEADGVSLLDGATLLFAPGGEVVLTAELDAGLDPRFSWYATVGRIERYRQNPTELATEADEAHSGWLVVVGRDGQGGVTWADVPMARPQ